MRFARSISSGVGLVSLWIVLLLGGLSPQPTSDSSLPAGDFRSESTSQAAPLQHAPSTSHPGHLPTPLPSVGDVRTSSEAELDDSPGLPDLSPDRTRLAFPSPTRTLNGVRTPRPRTETSAFLCVFLC